MLTLVEAGQRMGGASRMLVLRRIHSGELEGINIAPKGAAKPRWRVSEAALERYFERRRSTGIPKRRVA